MRGVLRRLVAAAAVAAVALGIVVAVPGAASAVDTRTFDPGRIISDGLFYDSSAMNAAQVQAFVESKSTSCVTTGTKTCLKDYAEMTPTRPADAYCTGTYTGATSERASVIIAKAAVACGINPQVLLVIIQKEQSLVTTAQTADKYAKALGMGCPDGQQCQPQYAGFANQVYSAARQYERYRAGVAGSYRAGVVNHILYNPNRACGTKDVVIDNQATAGLYDYTPYTPNDALLAGAPDSCSSYGNYNFWKLFNQWFGPTTDVQPMGFVDSMTASDRAITVKGWALDLDTSNPISIHVYVDPGTVNQTATAFVANVSRSDLDAAFHRGANHGYSATVPASVGTHTVCVWAIDDYSGPGTVGNTTIDCRSVTVVNHAPQGSVDRVDGGSGTVRAYGWAFDPDTATGAIVNVVVDGKATAGTATAKRADIASAFGFAGPSGFDVTAAASAGNHQVCVQVLDSLTGKATSLGCRTVSVGQQATGDTADGVVPVAPVRLVDSWSGSQPTTGRCVAVSGAGVPADANGVVVNVTVTGVTSGGNVVVFPDDGTSAPKPPLASTVNLEAGQDVSNASWVQVGGNGRICWAAQGSGGLRTILDVSGYTTAGSGVQLQAPKRLLDTRAATHVGDLGAPLPANTLATVQVAGTAGVPANAIAVVLNVTVVDPAGYGNIQVFPSSGSRPTASTLNYAPGMTKANVAVVGIGSEGKIALYSEIIGATPVQVVLDVEGYVTAGSAYHPVTPQRLLDTRTSTTIPALTAGKVAPLDVRMAAKLPAGATGVVLNVTAVGPTTVGNLRVYPDADGNGRTPPPWVSAISYVVGRDIAGLVTVALPADGKIDLYSDQLTGGRTNVLVDIVGYTTG